MSCLGGYILSTEGSRLEVILFLDLTQEDGDAVLSDAVVGYTQQLNINVVNESSLQASHLDEITRHVSRNMN